MKAIPNRWMNYTNSGRQISGTRFIAFKTPLRNHVCSSIHPNMIFTTRDLVDSCSSLGLVINLTFKGNDGYYDFQDLTYAGIDYSALPIPGKIVPESDYVFRFYQIVEKFLNENENNDKLIGVHCTHGLNRTGYLVCRYMIDRLKVPPDQAIIEFNSARGHEQEHDYYLKDLRTTQLGQQYRAWRKEQAAKNPESKTHKNRWQRDERPIRDWSSAAETSFQQLSRKRKSTEMIDSPADQSSSHKRVKYSSDVTVVDRHRELDHDPRRHSGGGSPTIGQDYYQQYYRGEVHHQYVMDYYHPRGSTETGLENSYGSQKTSREPPRRSVSSTSSSDLKVERRSRPTSSGDLKVVPNVELLRSPPSSNKVPKVERRSPSSSSGDLKVPKVELRSPTPSSTASTSSGSGKSKTARVPSPDVGDKHGVANGATKDTKVGGHRHKSPKLVNSKPTKKPSIAQKVINKLKLKKPKRSKGF